MVIYKHNDAYFNGQHVLDKGKSMVISFVSTVFVDVTMTSQTTYN